MATVKRWIDKSPPTRSLKDTATPTHMPMCPWASNPAVARQGSTNAVHGQIFLLIRNVSEHNVEEETKECSSASNVPASRPAFCKQGIDAASMPPSAPCATQLVLPSFPSFLCNFHQADDRRSETKRSNSNRRRNRVFGDSLGTTM